MALCATKNFSEDVKKYSVALTAVINTPGNTCLETCLEMKNEQGQSVMLCNTYQM